MRVRFGASLRAGPVFSGGDDLADFDEYFARTIVEMIEFGPGRANFSAASLQGRRSDFATYQWADFSEPKCR
jgi:hypothetical protein